MFFFRFYPTRWLDFGVHREQCALFTRRIREWWETHVWERRRDSENVKYGAMMARLGTYQTCNSLRLVRDVTVLFNAWMGCDDNEARGTFSLVWNFRFVSEHEFMMKGQNGSKFKVSPRLVVVARIGGDSGGGASLLPIVGALRCVCVCASAAAECILVIAAINYCRCIGFCIFILMPNALLQRRHVQNFKCLARAHTHTIHRRIPFS